jgi:hypothetical protein
VFLTLLKSMRSPGQLGVMPQRFVGARHSVGSQQLRSTGAG